MRQAKMSTLQNAVRLICLIVIASSFAYSQEEIPKDFNVTLVRTLCFGSCPSYSLAITADGSVEFTPQGGGAYKGKGTDPVLPLKGKIAPDQIKDLLAELRKIGFYSLRKRYGKEEQAKSTTICPDYRTDHSTAIISLVANGKRKTIQHYLGCQGTKVLDDLGTLGNKVDEIANTGQWTSQYAWGTGNVVDLKIQVNHSNLRSQ